MSLFKKIVRASDPAATYGYDKVFKKPKKPGKTPEQIANEVRIRRELDEVKEEEEERQAAIARGKLGRSSMLSGAPRTIAESAGRPKQGGGGGAGSLLSGVRGATRTGGGSSPVRQSQSRK